MSSALSCPPPEKVQDLLDNRLSQEEASALRQHLRDCRSCRERLNLDVATPPRYGFLSPPREEGELGWLDTYRIVGVLGEGGMAVVFDAEDTVLGRRVALKVLRPDLADASLRERFFHEARLLASLSHENIVSIYQVGEANGVPFLAMERLEGMTLHDKLQQDRWLPLVEALSLARQTAEGLAVLHQHGMVHRDVKPANVWLEVRHGQFRRIKLIDFGIARRMEDSSKLTLTGQIVGTLVYMAPEQAAGQKVDGRADLYSLGCMLFHMLTGQPPLGGKKSSETQILLREIVRGQTVVVRESAPQIPASVALLIQDLLARKPEDRPASAEIVAERLHPLEREMREEPGLAASAGAAPEIRYIGRRPSSLSIWLGGATLLLALIVGLVAAWVKIVTPGPVDSKATVPNAGNRSSNDPKLAKGRPIKVGILYSLSGYLSSRERPLVHALQLAYDEINAAGGVLGRQIVPIEEDGASDPEVFAERARFLIQEKKVDVLFGCWSSASRKSVAPVCQEGDRLLFYVVADEGLENSPAVIYLGGTPNQLAVPAVQWARKEGKQRFYLVGTEDVFSRVMQAVLEHQVQSEGGMLVGKSSLVLEEARFGPVVESIKSSKPDIILNTSTGHDLVPFFRALRGAGNKTPQTPTIWLSLSENELTWFPIESLQGDYASACYFGSLEKASSREFLERYRDKFGSKERVNDDMQTAYFGFYLWKKAVEKADSTETGSIRRVLRGMKVDAPEGEIQIDPKWQHARRYARIGRVEASKPLPQFRIVYQSPEALPPDPFPSWRSEHEWDRFLKDLYLGWDKHWEKLR
jgi:urea transport system substrate-binding protein